MSNTPDSKQGEAPKSQSKAYQEAAAVEARLRSIASEHSRTLELMNWKLSSRSVAAVVGDVQTLLDRIEKLELDPNFSSHYLYGFELCREQVKNIIKEHSAAASSPASPVQPPSCAFCDSGLVFNEKEIAALSDLYERTGISTAKILKHALALYQSHIVNGWEVPLESKLAPTPVVAREVGFLHELCAAIVAGERDAKDGHDVVTVGIYRELFDRCASAAATTSPSSETPQLTELQLAYNQGIEDAKCAIRATLTGGEGDRFKPYFITQIARTCSPFRYVAGKFTAPTYDQTVQAITDIQEARESHVQWAAHLRDADREDCKGCDGHAAHIGDAAYHDEWVAKYDNVIYVLAHAPFAATSSGTPVGGEGQHVPEWSVEHPDYERKYWSNLGKDIGSVAATGDDEGELRTNPRVNALLVTLRKVRDKAPTLEAAQAIATVAIEEYVDATVEGDK